MEKVRPWNQARPVAQWVQDRDVEYQIHTTKVVGLILTLIQMQVTLNKLLTCCVVRPTQPSTLSGTGGWEKIGGDALWLRMVRVRWQSKLCDPLYNRCYYI